jgi:hypothetical protein
MLEPLSRREKCIILIMYTILREDIKNLDFEKKLEALHGMLIACDIHINDREIEDIVVMANQLMVSGQGGALQTIYKMLQQNIGKDIPLMKL